MLDFEIATKFLKEVTSNFEPEIALVLGSGLGSFSEGLEGTTIDYEDIPGFPKSTVEGHAGKLTFCEINGKKVVVMSGRFHFYEGYTLSETTLPIRVFKKLGVQKIILTNAAGGINGTYRVGDLVLIKDHINMMGTNPLIGKNDDSFGPRFLDMTCAYDPELRKIALAAAKDLGIGLKQGIYIGLTGPTYETPSEVKMLAMFGGDLVGMSTVAETIVARHCGMEVLGISLCSNPAAGVGGGVALSHEEVVEAGKIAGKKFAELIKEILTKM
jgi:purine-nucleoside phosphorylase